MLSLSPRQRNYHDQMHLCGGRVVMNEGGREVAVGRFRVDALPAGWRWDLFHYIYRLDAGLPDCISCPSSPPQKTAESDTP